MSIAPVCISENLKIEVSPDDYLMHKRKTIVIWHHQKLLVRFWEQASSIDAAVAVICEQKVMWNTPF